MKMKKPKKMIEAKQEDVILVCTMGKSSMIVARRMKNGKYEMKSTYKGKERSKVFEKSEEILELIQEMISDYESKLISEDEEKKPEEEVSNPEEEEEV